MTKSEYRMTKKGSNDKARNVVCHRSGVRIPLNHLEFEILSSLEISRSAFQTTP
jgi:hypothetical protein